MKNEFMKADNTDIIIFGCGFFGQIASRVVKSLGKKVVAVCDNNPAKRGFAFCGVPVHTLSDVMALKTEVSFVVCIGSEQGKEAIKKQLAMVGCVDNVYMIEEVFELYHRHVLNRPVAEYIGREQVILDRVLLVVTDKCSLKCKDCAHLVTHYKNPQHYPKDLLVKSIRNFAQSVDKINILSILGGEPLIHPEIGDIFQEVSKISNIEAIVVATNGTIVPDDDTLRKLKASVTYVSISNYGKCSIKLKELEKTGRICDSICNW